MGSIRRHKNAMTALLAEYHETPFHGTHLEEEIGEFVYINKRREDEVGTAGGMCESIVRYARPQKAKSAAGEWKFIVNTGQHTQTLRLEKCSHPQESCSYLTHQYRSHCTQVYNYHRLLSWDKSRGLHVDIFKVPTCCTCQVDGYRQQFPPLAANKDKDFTPAHLNPLEPYSTINEDLDYNDEEDEDDLSFHFANGGFSKLKGREPHEFDANELQAGSKTVHTNVYPPNPTVGAYLSPPDHSIEVPFGYHAGNVGSGSGKVSKNLIAQHKQARRRPYKSLTGISEESLHEGRGDLEISPSEVHSEKEVKLYGSMPPKLRKPIYSVPHTAEAAVAGTATSGRYSTRIRNPSSTSTRPHTTDKTTSTGRFTQQSTNTAASHATYGGGRGSRKPQSTRYTHATTAKTSTRTRSSASASTSGSSASSSYATTPIVNSSTSTTQSENFNLNAMYSAKLNASNAAKRINYNYHPIIDFFEVNTRYAPTTTTPLPHLSPYAHTIPKVGRDVHNYQSHERRIGFGAIGSPAYSGDANDWKPLVN